jgi:hypothetical protein
MLPAFYSMMASPLTTFFSPFSQEVEQASQSVDALPCLLADSQLSPDQNQACEEPSPETMGIPACGLLDGFASDAEAAGSGAAGEPPATELDPPAEEGWIAAYVSALLSEVQEQPGERTATEMTVEFDKMLCSSLLGIPEGSRSFTWLHDPLADKQASN